MKFRKLLLPALLCAVALVSSGCASFRNNEVAEVSALPDVSRYQQKPSVFVETHLFHGDPAKPVIEILHNKDKIQGVVHKCFEGSSLFSKYSFDAAEKDNADYAIKIDIYNHGDLGAAAVLGFISGFTFGVIPAAATDNYTLEAKLVDKAGAVVSKVSNKDSITTWIGIWFIPAAANTPEKAFTGTLENQLRSVLKELVESGKLQYSINRAMSPTHPA